jgi:phage-related protein
VALDVGELVARLSVDDGPFKRSLRSAHRDLRQLDIDFRKVASAGGKVVLASTAITGVATAANAAVVAVAALAPAAGAALGSLPGLALGAAAAFGVLKIATLGFGEALQAVGDPEKFAKAVEGLSPAARQAAVAVQGLANGPFRQLRMDVQETFFLATGPLVSRFGAALTALRGPAVGIAAAFNSVVKRVLTLGASDAVISPLGRVMRGVQDAIMGAGRGVDPLIAGFAALAGQAGAFGVQVGAALGTGLTRFGELMTRLDLAQMFRDAREVLTPVVGLFRDLGTIVTGVFTALGGSGAQALGVVGAVVHAVAGFVSGAEGAAALGALGEAMRAIAGSAGQIVIALLSELAPLVTDLAKVVSPLASAIGAILVPAVRLLGPPLQVVVNGLVTLLTPLLESETAMRLIVGGVIAWTVAQWALNIALAANPIGLVIIAIAALVGAIVWVATKTTWFQATWEAVWGFLKGVGHWFANDFVNFFVNTYNTLGRKTQELILYVMSRFDALVGFVTGLPGRIWAAATGMFMGIVAAFRGAVNWVIRLWNNFSLTLGGGSILGIGIPSVTLYTPDIPYLAEGGIVPATPGGRLARVGEREDEAVIPLSKLAAMLGRGGGGTRIIRFEVGDQFRTWMREDVHAAGGVDSYFAPA